MTKPETNDGARATTREANALIGCRLWETLPLLRAARVPHSRCGNGYLWDRSAVEALALSLAQARERAAL